MYVTLTTFNSAQMVRLPLFSSFFKLPMHHFPSCTDMKIQLLLTISRERVDYSGSHWCPLPYPVWILLTKFCCHLLHRIALKQQESPHQRGYTTPSSFFLSTCPQTSTNNGLTFGYNSPSRLLWDGTLCAPEHSHESRWEPDAGADHTLACLFSSALHHFPLSPSPGSVLPVNLLNKNTCLRLCF